MWEDGAEWQCGGCTGFTSQFTRLEFLDGYDARFVIVTNGPIDEALAYRDKVGNKMDWYSSSESSFGADVDAPPGAGFGVNVFLRDGDKVYRTWHTNGRGTEQLSHAFAPHRSAAVRASGGVAGSARRLAAVAYVLAVARTRLTSRRPTAQLPELGVYFTQMSPGVQFPPGAGSGAGSTFFGAGPTGSGTCWGAGPTGSGTCCTGGTCAGG